MGKVRNIEIIKPGFTKCEVLTRSYANGTGETGVNVFDPYSDRPLDAGEWLERDADGKFTRGGDGEMADSEVPDDEGTVPAYVIWDESGRTDSQVAKVCNGIFGPKPILATTTVFQDSTLVPGDELSVWDIKVGGTGVVRRGLAKKDTGFVVARFVRYVTTSKIEIEII